MTPTFWETPRGRILSLLVALGRRAEVKVELFSLGRSGGRKDGGECGRRFRGLSRRERWRREPSCVCHLVGILGADVVGHDGDATGVGGK